jgi:hypothetical protein
MSDEQKPASSAIPYERFQAVNEQRKEAQAEIAQLKQQLADVQKQAGAADALFSQLEVVNKTLQTERETWNQERSLMSAGLLDKEARDLAVWSYSRIEGDDKPPLNDWLEGMKADPEKVPAYLAPYLGGKQEQKPTAPPMPDTNRGAVPSTMENGAYQKGSIASMSIEEYKAQREKIRSRYLDK